MAASSWIIPAILFGLGILIGYLAKREKHYTDLEEGITYYQDILPGKIFFLRKKGESNSHIYILNHLDDNNLTEISVSGEADYFFRIKKKGDRYFLTIIE